LIKDPIALNAKKEWEAMNDTLGTFWFNDIHVIHKSDLSSGAWHWEPKKSTITVSDSSGLLYAVFGLNRHLILSGSQKLFSTLSDAPKISLRIINHWDNIHPKNDIERGYGGVSIFQWDKLPVLSPCYEEYAWLLASVGINAIIVNNVNAGEPKIGGYRLLT
jgi:alpha-glucuronidase